MLLPTGLIKMFTPSRVWMKFCTSKELKNDMCTSSASKLSLNSGDVAAASIPLLCSNKASHRYAMASLSWINDEGKFSSSSSSVALSDNCSRIETASWQYSSADLWTFNQEGTC